MVQNTVSYQTQEIITWISMLQVTGRGYWFFHSQEMDCGLIERIPCGNIFTAFRTIGKKISTKNAAAKFDLQCYNTYRNTFSLTNIVIYEKCQRMNFSMNNTLA